MPIAEATPAEGKVLTDLLKDHVELAALEWSHEKQKGLRRLLVMGTGALFFVSSFAMLQVYLFFGLLNAGWKPGWTALALAIFNFAIGGGIVWFFLRPDPNAPKPFEGSVEELKRSAQWIQKRFL